MLLMWYAVRCLRVCTGASAIGCAAAILAEMRIYVVLEDKLYKWEIGGRGVLYRGKVL